MKKILGILSLLLLTADVGIQAAEQPAEELQVEQQVRGKCPICIEEDIVLDAQLNCGHQFCMPCIKDGYSDGEGEYIDGWLHESATCPACRADVTTINDQPVRVPFKPSPALSHVFNFAPDINRRIIVAPLYRQQIQDFVHQLNVQEYQALLDEYSDDEDSSLEIILSLTPEWVDDTWLPLERRMAFFRNYVGLQEIDERLDLTEAEDYDRQDKTNHRAMNNAAEFDRLYFADQFIEDEDLFDPADHVFDFTRPVIEGMDQFVIPDAYYQEIRDFIDSLTPREYTVLWGYYEGKIEENIFTHPEWIDQTWLTQEIRMEIFRRDLNISTQDLAIEVPDIDEDEREARKKARYPVRGDS